MNAASYRQEPVEAKEKWSVVVVYEDAATRQRATSVCDFLVKQFWSEMEFDFEWCRADSLANRATAEEAASKAAEADFVIICPSLESDLSPALQTWFDNWAERRDGREGALVVDLSEGDAIPSASVQRKILFLRDVAHRAQMDYLSCVPSTLKSTLPSSFQDAELRADQMSSVLDDILNRVPPPTHFGLNE